MSSELNVSEEDVRREHLQEVNVGAHWTYLLGVLVGGVILMVLLLAFLGAAS